MARRKITLRFPTGLHTRLRVAAALADLTVPAYVLRELRLGLREPWPIAAAPPAEPSGDRPAYNVPEDLFAELQARGAAMRPVRKPLALVVDVLWARVPVVGEVHAAAAHTWAIPVEGE